MTLQRAPTLRTTVVAATVPAAKVHPLEEWRRSVGLTQTDVGARVKCSADTIARAEQGLAIRTKYVQRLVEISRGKLKVGDFTKSKPRAPVVKKRAKTTRRRKSPRRK